MRVRRRTMLAALGLTGCAPTPSPSMEPTTAPSSQVAPPTTGDATPSSPPSATTWPSPALPTKDEIIARYAAERPSSFGMDVPGVLTKLGDTGRFALTFDACGGAAASAQGMGYDAALIGVLREFGVPATLFLNARWLAQNRKVAEELAADKLFEIGNHGTRHVPLTVVQRSAYGIDGTRSAAEVYDEVATCQAELTALLGRPPRFFRSGTAHVDDVAVRIARDLGVQVANFSVNADAGATLPAKEVARQLATVRGGDIVIAHFNRPSGGTAAGLRAALRPLLDKGLKPARLSDIG